MRYLPLMCITDVMLTQIVFRVATRLVLPSRWRLKLTFKGTLFFFLLQISLICFQLIDLFFFSRSFKDVCCCLLRISFFAGHYFLVSGSLRLLCVLKTSNKTTIKDFKSFFLTVVSFRRFNKWFNNDSICIMFGEDILERIFDPRFVVPPPTQPNPTQLNPCLGRSIASN